MNEQQKYLEKLQKLVIPELMVTNDILKPTTNKYEPGKRQKVQQLNWHDQRTVALNEIIFDLDWKSYARNTAEAKKIITALAEHNITPLVCPTGGKGIHIHIFFNRIKILEQSNRDLLNAAFEYGLQYKHIRNWFWNLILDEIGSDSQFRGDGKQFDSAPMNFDYDGGTSKLIRDIGGRKYTQTQEGEWMAFYKSWIPTEEVNKQKKHITSIEDVRFPSDIIPFNIDEYQLCEYLAQFINKAKNNNENKLQNIQISVKYTEIDGVLKIREGMDTGQRSFGARVISFACKIDNLTKTEALEILQEYVNNCSQTSHSFTIDEAKQWLDWVYSHDKVYWNCSQLKSLGVHDEHLCEFCQAQHKEAIKFLTSSTILKQVEEVLDEQIIGEGHNKVLIFLLLLSKDFPSPTGMPDWNIPSDSMSQNIILSADSASGKTYIIKGILKLFGIEGEDYFIISRITKNAFNYYTVDNMDRKIIFIEELQGLDEHTEQLRVWMSEGKLSLKSVEKVKDEDGVENLALSDKVTKGQPCFVTCQAEGVVGEQLLNRSWILSTDITEVQSKKILEYQSKLKRGELVFDSTKLQTIRDALKQLKPYHFINPFADNIAMNIPTSDVRVRRDYVKFLTLIECSAYLHQKRREIIVKNEKEYIICSIEDYEIAKQYSENILGATFSGLTNGQIDVLNIIKQIWPIDSFKISDVQRNLGKTQQHWYGVLKQLADLGFLTYEGKRGISLEFTLVPKNTLNLMSLPSGEELMKRLGKI